jgi:hypothetical protein
MRDAWRQLLRRRHGLPVAVWLLLLLCANALQVVAATHWHSNAIAIAAGSGSAPQPPAPDGVDHDGCLFCQVAAHSGASAPPTAPWALFTVIESRAGSLQFVPAATARLTPSHAWQGRAPPLV